MQVMVTTKPYALSLHDALPIYPPIRPFSRVFAGIGAKLVPFRITVPGWSLAPGIVAFSAQVRSGMRLWPVGSGRSEEHTSELQSRRELVCRLLLEKKKTVVVWP